MYRVRQWQRDDDEASEAVSEGSPMLNMSGDSEANATRTTVEATASPRLQWQPLQDLAPHYVPSMHAGYLRALIEGIEAGQATNIALSGPYGAGKSSILEGLTDRYPDQTIQVSLATVRSSSSEKSAGKKVAEPSASDLQKEIVKQVLYVVDPSKMPASRFPRTSKFRWLKSLGWALLAGATGVAVQWIITLVVASLQQDSTLTWRPEFYIPTLGSVAVVSLLLLRITNGRLAISHLAAGPAKLTLSDKSGSYFDDYLDEIVYFFQVSKTRILVLEDMDRFDNIEVFEDLRALNVLLNHSAQLKAERLHGKTGGLWNRFLRRRPWRNSEKLNLDELEDLGDIPKGFHHGPIVFVYAVRDSLLAKTVEATGDVQHDAFTRTKFFDLIVPVVPFVTEQNARGALKKELQMLAGVPVDGSAKKETGTEARARAEGRPSQGLARRIAQYFPDQRQIRNIRNEFAMYRNRLLQPGAHPEELTPDRLLALVLYKNLEVADFELIRLGKSTLHVLLRLSQALVLENLGRINLRLSYPSEEAQRDQAAALAALLLKKTTALGVSFEQVVQSRQNVRYRAMTLEQLSDLDLWRRVAAGEAITYNQGKSLNRKAIESAFSVSLSFAEQTAVPLAPEERNRLEADRELLESATWHRLWGLPQFVLSPDSDAWAKGREQGEALSFSQIVIAEVGEGLTSDLIASGHLTQNFALLSAHVDVQFLGIEAQNFIQTSIEHPGRAPLAPVSEDAISEILEDRTPLVLERSGMVNIHVLNYLLVHAPQESRRVIAQLRSWTNADETFIHNFFSRYGNNTDIAPLRDAITCLANLTSEVILSIINDHSLSDDRKASLFEAALSGSQSEHFSRSVAGDERARLYAQQNHPRFGSMKRDTPESTTAASRLVLLGTTIDDLEPLSISVRDLFVEQGLFAMTAVNLSVIVGRVEAGWVSLEQLKTSPTAYNSTLPRIGDYLELFEGQETSDDMPSAETATALAEILEDLLEELGDDGEPQLRAVAHHALSSVRVLDITQNADIVQEVLLLEQCAETSTSNLLARFKANGTVTEGIATALHNEPRPEISDDTDLSEFVSSVLLATEIFTGLLTDDVLSNLVGQLNEHIAIPAATWLKATPSVAVRLVDEGWGELEELRAAADITLDWSVREALLAKQPTPNSSETCRLVSTDDVTAFLKNEAIDVNVRAYVGGHLSTLLTSAQATQNADAIATFFNERSISLSLEGIHALAAADASRASLIALLNRHDVQDAFAADPAVTLKILGGEYAAIVDMTLPSPKFAPTAQHHRFLSTLEKLGIVRRLLTKADGMFRIRRVK